MLSTAYAGARMRQPPRFSILRRWWVAQDDLAALPAAG
jgi:hypothetical protein